MKMLWKCATPILLAVLFGGSAMAASLTVDMHTATKDGTGAGLGTVLVTESPYGLVFTANLHGLPPGLHGFHVHQNPDGGAAPDPKTGEIVPAGAAGGHLDPKNTGKHGAPWDDGAHLGDLPPLYVDANGKSTISVLAPRIRSLDTIRNHSLMIHAGGDNFSDQPQPLGGGGARVGVGIIR